MKRGPPGRWLARLRRLAWHDLAWVLGALLYMAHIAPDVARSLPQIHAAALAQMAILDAECGQGRAR